MAILCRAAKNSLRGTPTFPTYLTFLTYLTYLIYLTYLTSLQFCLKHRALADCFFMIGRKFVNLFAEQEDFPRMSRTTIGPKFVHT